MENPREDYLDYGIEEIGTKEAKARGFHRQGAKPRREFLFPIL